MIHRCQKKSMGVGECIGVRVVGGAEAVEAGCDSAAAAALVVIVVVYSPLHYISSCILTERSTSIFSRY